MRNRGDGLRTPPGQHFGANTVLFKKALVGTALLMCLSCSLAQNAWPKVALPKGVGGFEIGSGTVTANGLPMRLQGFQSPEKIADLASWFRQSLGKPLAENKMAKKLILGQMRGDYYVTIQLEPLGTGTKGTVAVTYLKGAHENNEQIQATRERWLLRLPAGSQLLSLVSSEDAGKISTHLVVLNSHDEDVNRNSIAAMMREDGLELERETAADPGTSPYRMSDPIERKTLFFKGHDKEAVVVISRNGPGRTAIVFNTITSMERYK